MLDIIHNYVYIIYNVLLTKIVKRISMRGEKKQDRFKRLGSKRVQRVIDSIQSLSQLSNKRMYEWTDSQVNKMWNAVDKELKACKDSFDNSEPEEFKF